MGEARAQEAVFDTGEGQEKKRHVRRAKNLEPRWPALLALMALGGLYAAL